MAAGDSVGAGWFRLYGHPDSSAKQVVTHARKQQSPLSESFDFGTAHERVQGAAVNVVPLLSSYLIIILVSPYSLPLSP